MLDLLVVLLKTMGREPTSTQREVVNGLEGKEAKLELSNQELIALYDRLNTLVKKRRVNRLSLAEKWQLIKHPRTI